MGTRLRILMLVTMLVLFGNLAAARSGEDARPVLLAQASQVDIQNRGAEESDVQKRARLRMELAVNYFEERRFSVALDELKQALTLVPNYADAIGVLALVYMELGEKNLAEQSFRRAMQLKPDDSDLNVNFGWFLCSTGRERESISFFLTALKNPLYTRPALPYQNAGVCSLKFRDVTAAENYLKRSFELDPRGRIAAVSLAQIFYDRGEYDRARFYVAKINQSDGAYPESVWLGAKIERKLGNRNEEASLLAQLRRLFPNSTEAAALARGAYDD